MAWLLWATSVDRIASLSKRWLLESHPGSVEEWNNRGRARKTLRLLGDVLVLVVAGALLTLAPFLKAPELQSSRAPEGQRANGPAAPGFSGWRPSEPFAFPRPGRPKSRHRAGWRPEPRGWGWEPPVNWYSFAAQGYGYLE